MAGDNLNEIKVQLARVIERLDNLIDLFNNHKEEDDRVEERVRKLEIKVWGMGVAATIIASSIEYWGKLLK